MSWKCRNFVNIKKSTTKKRITLMKLATMNLATTKTEKVKTTSISLETMIDFLKKSPKTENPTPFKNSTIFYYLRKK